MAWGSVGTAGTFGNSGNNQVNFSLTTTATIEAGNCGVLILVADNARTTDGDDVIISGSITDSAGNTWTKAIGWCNANAAAQAGVALEVWYCKLGTQLAS